MSDALLSLKRSLREIRRSGKLEIHERVDLRAWTGLRVGGIADLVVRCHSQDAVQEAIDLMAAHGTRWLMLGSAGRLVPHDRGLRIPALSLSGELVRWQLEDDGVVAGAGANLTQLGRSLAHAGQRGMGRFLGSGSTLAGAIISGRAEQRSRILEAMDWVDVVRPGVSSERIPVSGAAKPYDVARLDRQRSVIVRCRLLYDLSHTAVEPVDEQDWQVGPRTVMGVFENPEGRLAEDLLEEAECRRLFVRGAKVPEISANAVCTSRTCSAADVTALVGTMRQKVLDLFGIDLALRIRLVDEDGRKVEL